MVEQDGRTGVETFIEGLGANFQANAAGIVAMMEMHSEHGSAEFNTKQCHYVDQGEEIYEYIKGRLRFFWYEDEDRIVICTHGIIKKDQKTPKREIDKAIRIKKAYLSAKENGDLVYIEDEDRYE